MILEIYNANMECIQTVDFESSCWDAPYMQKMSKYGYSFKLDGEWVLRGSSNQNTSSCECPCTTDCAVCQSQNSDISVNDTFDDTENSKVLRINRSISVQCLETGMQYESIRAASKDTGISETSIRKSMNTGNPVKSHTFELIDMNSSIKDDDNDYSTAE